MRNDLEALLEPLERAKHARRRAAVRSRYAIGAAVMLLATVALIFEKAHRLAVAGAFLLLGAAVILYQLERLARMPGRVPPEWLLLAVECRLSCAGRAALTPMLMAGAVSGDEALAWARAERGRLIDTLRETALCEAGPHR